MKNGLNQPFHYIIEIDRKLFTVSEFYTLARYNDLIEENTVPPSLDALVHEIWNEKMPLLKRAHLRTEKL
jgi:hypothetical protein